MSITWISQLPFRRRQTLYKVIIMNKPPERSIFPNLQCQVFFWPHRGRANANERFCLLQTLFVPFQHIWYIPVHDIPLLIPNSPISCKPCCSTAEYTQLLLQLDLGNRSGFPLCSCSIPAQTQLGLMFDPLISVLSVWAYQPVQQPQSILNNLTCRKRAKFLKNRKDVWMSHSTAQPRKSFSPVTEWFGQEGTVKTIQCTPVAVQREENSSGKIFSCLSWVMVSHFNSDFVTWPVILKKLTLRERNITVLGWEEVFTRTALRAQKRCIFHLCEKKKWKRNLLRTAWPCWRKGLLCFPTGAWNRQKWKLVTKGTAKNTPSSLELRVVCPHRN